MIHPNPPAQTREAQQSTCPQRYGSVGGAASGSSRGGVRTKRTPTAQTHPAPRTTHPHPAPEPRSPIWHNLKTVGCAELWIGVIRGTGGRGGSS